MSRKRMMRITEFMKYNMRQIGVPYNDDDEVEIPEGKCAEDYMDEEDYEMERIRNQYKIQQGWKSSGFDFFPLQLLGGIVMALIKLLPIVFMCLVYLTVTSALVTALPIIAMGGMLFGIIISFKR